jgi:hypothetical protein
LSSSVLAAPSCSLCIGEVPATTTAVPVQKTNILAKYLTNTLWTVETDAAAVFYTTSTTLPAPIFAAENAQKPLVERHKYDKGKAAASISHACSGSEFTVEEGAPAAAETSTTATSEAFQCRSGREFANLLASHSNHRLHYGYFHHNNDSSSGIRSRSVCVPFLAC